METPTIARHITIRAGGNVRESGYDLNELLYRQQLALIEADAAPTEVTRAVHLHIARAYEDEITRRTDGRLRFGRAAQGVLPVVARTSAPTLTLVAAA